MDCLIDNTIKENTEKGKTIEFIEKVIAKTHGIRMDRQTLKRRISKIQMAIQSGASSHIPGLK